MREIRKDGWQRTQPAGAYPLGYYSVSATAGSASNLNFGDILTPATTPIT